MTAPDSITAGPLTILPPRRLVLHGAVPLRMSSKEYDALLVLALANGRPVAPADLMLLVLGRAWLGSNKDANAVIFRLRRRLPTLPDGSSLIVTVIGQGFALLMPPTEPTP